MQVRVNIVDAMSGHFIHVLFSENLFFLRQNGNVSWVSVNKYIFIVYKLQGSFPFMKLLF